MSSDQGSCTLSLISSYGIESLLPNKRIPGTCIRELSYVFSGKSCNSLYLLYAQAGPPLSFGNNTGSQDGTQLGGCLLLQRKHPVLTDHVASLLLWPGSRLFPSVRLAAHDITGPCHNHNVILLGTKPISFPL